MATQIFVNLPVKNLSRSIAFFEALGYSFNPQFTDDKAGCLVISDTIYAMLLTEPFFKTFTKKEITDASKATEVIIAISVESKKEVDELVNKAFKAGGARSNDPQDYGWMYSWSFQDPDGHLWEVLYTDPAGPQS
ncbi:VOC family protein [Chryseolinea sp. H1M3-3]|uniref:VOC family protein n=1 Tax=Chryseolinea sp. H1M3-3 TaxID=3034144 RepID=UPI0023ED3760|nr:VOC family protein [Chryseolinea sp. H1M3-3]